MSEPLNHLCSSALGDGKMWSANCLFRLDQFSFFFPTYLKELLKPLVLGVDGLFVADPQDCHPHRALIHVCEEEWFHPDAKMDQTCFSSSGLKAFSALSSQDTSKLADRSAPRLSGVPAFPSLHCPSPFPPRHYFRTWLG